MADSAADCAPVVLGLDFEEIQPTRDESLTVPPEFIRRALLAAVVISPFTSGGAESSPDALQAPAVPEVKCPSGTERVEEANLGRWCVRSQPSGGKIKEGPVVHWYSSGALMRTGQYRNDLKEGRWKVWYSNGARMAEGEFREGRQQGTARVWYENGRLKVEVELKDDLKAGKLQRWYMSGQLHTEARYSSGKLNGVWKTWHPNGRLSAEARFVNDKLEGLVRQWNPEGKLVGEVTYKDDKPVKIGKGPLNWLDPRKEIPLGN